MQRVKLTEDFAKIKKGWSQTSSMQAYSFVFNDKYEGVFPDIAKELEQLSKKNAGVRCRPFTAGHLESEFMSLSADGIHAVLGASFQTLAG